MSTLVAQLILFWNFDLILTVPFRLMFKVRNPPTNPSAFYFKRICDRISTFCFNIGKFSRLTLPNSHVLPDMWLPRWYLACPGRAASSPGLSWWLLVQIRPCLYVCDSVWNVCSRQERELHGPSLRRQRDWHRVCRQKKYNISILRLDCALFWVWILNWVTNMHVQSFHYVCSCLTRWRWGRATMASSECGSPEYPQWQPGRHVNWGREGGAPLSSRQQYYKSLRAPPHSESDSESGPDREGRVTGQAPCHPPLSSSPHHNASRSDVSSGHCEIVRWSEVRLFSSEARANSHEGIFQILQKSLCNQRT